MLDDNDVTRTAEWIAAAERYFADLGDVRPLFDKPFVPLEHAGYHVARVGYLLHHLEHEPGHTVLDFGAGMCWLSVILARNGSQVIAVDVSPTALRYGAEVIRRADLLEGTPAPRLLTYDGWRLPLPDASVDRIACFDALHHVPNKRAVLTEMHRVLRRGGRVCFVEPGPGHAASDEAREEAAHWGVLEDEVDAPALCAMAIDAGFRSAYIVPLPNPADNRLSPESYRRLRAGVHPASVTWSGNDALIVASKLPVGMRDSRSSKRIAAEFEFLDGPERVEPGQRFSLRVKARNVGEALWLGLPQALHAGAASAFENDAIAGGGNCDAYRAFISAQGLEGIVTVGMQLTSASYGALHVRDYARGFLARDVAPGEGAIVEIDSVAPTMPGVYRLTIDGVAEELCWFAQRGSSPSYGYLRCGDAPPDSRAPGRLRAEIAVHRSSTDEQLLEVSIRNVGDTVWLGAPLATGGWVRLGVQTADHAGRVIDRDWRRVALPHDVCPGEQCALSLALPHIAGIESYRFDLVDELVTWFEDRGSQVAVLRLPGSAARQSSGT